MFDLFDSQSKEPKQPRPHQVKAIQMLRQSLARGNKSVVCSMPTGAGKTVTASEIIRMAQEKGNGVIFTAPAISLIDQTVEAFEGQGIQDIGVMQANHPRTDYRAKVQIASVQTLSRREIPEAALIIVDECHMDFKVITKLMQERKDARFIGLSATPWRKGMGLQWNDLIVPITIKELIDSGLLSQFKGYAPSVPDLTGVKVKAGEFVEAQLQELMGDAKLVGHVVQNWLEKGEDRPTLCFGVNTAHAFQMATAFEHAGISAAYVDAYTDTVERAAINRQFRNGDVRVICSVRTMTTGVDLPVSCIIDAAPTMSEMLHIQKIGRGLRVNPGTEDLVIFDHAGNLLRLGMPDEISYDKLSKEKAGEPKNRLHKPEKLPKECSNCGVLHSGKTCPCCGHERKSFSDVQSAEGELTQINGKTNRATKEDKQKFYGMCVWMAIDRGYKIGWAANKYREKMGVWPRELNDTPIVPDKDFFNWEKSRRIAWAKRQNKEGN